MVAIKGSQDLSKKNFMVKLSRLLSKLFAASADEQTKIPSKGLSKRCIPSDPLESFHTCLREEGATLNVENPSIRKQGQEMQTILTKRQVTNAYNKRHVDPNNISHTSPHKQIYKCFIPASNTSYETGDCM